MKRPARKQKLNMDEAAQSQKRFKALFRRGTDMLHKGQTDRAVQLLERAHQINPEHVDTAVNLSGAYILAKQFKKAVEILSPLSEREPDHPMVWTNLGAAHLGNPILARNEEQQQAIAAFKRALAIHPAAPNVAYNIGLIYRDRSEHEAAVYWLKEALKANPNDKDARRLIEKLTANN